MLTEDDLTMGGGHTMQWTDPRIGPDISYQNTETCDGPSLQKCAK